MDPENVIDGEAQLSVRDASTTFNTVPLSITINIGPTRRANISPLFSSRTPSILGITDCEEKNVSCYSEFNLRRCIVG